MTPPVVRFAPSPTGVLHVGNVRTALINWLFARQHAGTFILRIDDTDTERSTAAYEEGIRDDLTWLGLTWDDTFRQSERFARYDAAANALRASGHLYACYETAEELDRQRRLQRAKGRPPIYNRAALDLTPADTAKYESEGRKPHWRFKLTGGRVEWNDLIRGPQMISTANLSDPILIRADGSYLYTLPSCVDDVDARITHVVRGEDHVTNSAAQIEIFHALGGAAPAMAHTPLLIGADGASLSKRIGSLGMAVLRTRGLEPMSVLSLLAKLGTSDNIEARTGLGELVAEFDFAKIGRSPARFDEAELVGLNAALIRARPFDAVADQLAAIDPKAANPAFWALVRENCATIADVAHYIPMAFGEVAPLIDEEDRDFIAVAARLLPEGEITTDTWVTWTNAVKAETGRKGRPLFMTLRRALTGAEHGPDMAGLLVIMGRDRVAARLG